EKSTVSFDRYIPAQALLGDGPKLAVETAPIVGATPATMIKAYGSRGIIEQGLPKRLDIPPTEWEFAWRHTVNWVGTVTEHGAEPVISCFFLRVPYSDLSSKARLLAHFRRKWG